jgi:nucleoside-diphosphate-sugar epimerase
LILLTGSNGFLGKNLINYLSAKIIKTLNRSDSDYEVDLSLNAPCFKDNFETVIHNAGKAHFIPRSKADIAAFYDVNVLGTKNLLIGLSKSPPKRFVFISSVSVYGLVFGQNINESRALLANDPYGKSKIEAEDVVKKWCDENNVICTILRLPLVVGFNPPGNLGSMIRGIKKGYYFDIVGGNAKKSMVLAYDVSKCILRAAEVGGTYNLTDGYHPSFYELSKLIASHYGRKFIPNMPFFLAKILATTGDILGSKFPFNSDKFKKITSTLTFDDSKAREAFGWNPTPVLKGFNIHE